jgi:hypothetical protein
VLAEAGVPYAIIGGVALQAHRTEPRTTVDIDIAVQALDALPRAALEAVGFRHQERCAHADNWIGPEGVPVRFTDDPALWPALDRALALDLDGVPLRVLSRADLLHEILRAGSDAAQRGSKRLQSLVDAEALLEEVPELRAELSEAERAILDSLPG